MQDGKDDCSVASLPLPWVPIISPRSVSLTLSEELNGKQQSTRHTLQIAHSSSYARSSSGVASGSAA